jgi:hypothetical protein
LNAMTVMPRGFAATADLARRETRPAVKAEAFTVMAFMVTADIVVLLWESVRRRTWSENPGDATIGKSSAIPISQTRW